MNNDNNDYSQGKIYKVWSPNHDKVYYGSTVRTLAERMKQHRLSHNKATSKQIIDAGDADIQLIEDYPCMNKYELEDREAEVMQADWDGCVNANVAGAVRRAGGKKAWWQEYRKVNAVQISALKKEYQKKNAAKISAQKKEYHKKNAEKIKAHNSKTYQCECGGKCRHADKARHFRSKMHQDHVEAEVALVKSDMISVLEAE